MLVSDKKGNELEDIFIELKDEQIRLVALLAAERMWKSFTNYLILERSPKLEESVRTCLDILWDSNIEGGISDSQNQEYERMLDIINSTTNEENPEEEFVDIYPLYLIGGLSSGRRFNSRKQVITTCSSKTVRPLDMICDDLLNTVTDNMLDTHPAVVAELNRIDDDIILAKGFPQNMAEVLKRKAFYQTLQLVPAIRLDCKHLFRQLC